MKFDFSSTSIILVFLCSREAIKSQIRIGTNSYPIKPLIFQDLIETPALQIF